MPVEDIADIELGTSEKTFDELDKAAAKAIKTLEKRNEELKKSMKIGKQEQKERDRKSKGVFESNAPIPKGGGAPQDIIHGESFEDRILRKAAEAAEKNSEKISDNIKRQLFGGELGPGTIKNMVSAAKDPFGFFTGVFRKVPAIGTLFAAKELTEFIINEVATLDAFFKAFVDRVDNRVNQLISKVQQAKIRAGDIQAILFTEAGGYESRVPYNTFNEFNKNRLEFENDYAIRNVVDT